MRLLEWLRDWWNKEVPKAPLRTYPDTDSSALAGGATSWTRPEDPDVRRGEGPEVG